MADVVDKAARSRMMSGIRAKNTRPEMFLRRALHALGFRFRLHVKEIPGKPDIVFPKYKALIIVHGCFWHGHDCRYFKLPKTNSAFWASKIAANRERDIRDQQAQQRKGWRVLVIWECAVRRSAHDQDFDVTSLASNWLRADSRQALIDETGINYQ